MESGQHEDSKTSSEENDQQDQVNNDVGTGRSYECIFCKRGFTTAQALGGHMNIHRRDRARIRQPAAPSVSNKPDEEHVGPAFFPPISSHPPPLYPPASETPRNYYMYLPPSTSSTRQLHHGYHADDLHIQKPQPALSLFRDDWRTSLSLQIGSSHVEHSEEEKKRDGGNDELDLELRLGYDP